MRLVTRTALSILLVAMLVAVGPSALAGDDGPRTPSTEVDPVPGNNEDRHQIPGTQGPASTPPMSIGSIGPQVPIIVPDLEHAACVGAQILAGASLEEALEACD